MAYIFADVLRKPQRQEYNKLQGNSNSHLRSTRMTICQLTTGGRITRTTHNDVHCPLKSSQELLIWPPPLSLSLSFPPLSPSFSLFPFSFQTHIPVHYLEWGVDWYDTVISSMEQPRGDLDVLNTYYEVPCVCVCQKERRIKPKGKALNWSDNADTIIITDSYKDPLLSNTQPYECQELLPDAL